MKYRPSRDIPEAARQLKSTRPVDIVEWILHRYNEERKQNSITMWFQRHPTILEDIEREIKEEQLPQKEIELSVYRSGTFEVYESVANWIEEQKERDVVRWKANVSTLKLTCQGIRPSMNRVKQFVWRKGDGEANKGIDLKEHGWVLRHPDRLDLEDARMYVRMMKEHYPKVDTSGERAVLRDFLVSKGIVVGKKISGTKHKSAGSLADLFVAKATLFKMLHDVKEKDFEAYVVNRFMWETATRVRSSLAIQIQNVKIKGQYFTAVVYDKGRRKIHQRGKKWEKNISKELYEEIQIICGYPERTHGDVFKIEYRYLVEINKAAVQKFCPEIIMHRGEDFPPYDDWNHFWRHMFFQHMLRQTGWNYAVAAALGGSTVKSLEESYGKPPEALIRKWGLEQLPSLAVK